MSLDTLDAFLAHARHTPELQEQLNGPLELEALLALAAASGYAISEADVLAAQEREESKLSDWELQERAGTEARKLRSFIHS
ncbi:Nif11-like leader peptide family RiPP precursor [Cyanobium sp. Morenito 9A2]|uniref:Nif11-like leader peptide family RiPP precursor n=1 Tax=Cyanobium sp. Morenito 9A2 TaxID=2823718 RepID=UPI0020CD9FA1|nr:Nif11-like leader peptide family RiPP precursor [Cyanobium sp. Morenito 9A2]MCP9848335.1 Nif11-like leader peptide family RiPP precursor [Cyanobium sp. Morenito 9A2]